MCGQNAKMALNPFRIYGHVRFLYMCAFRPAHKMYEYIIKSCIFVDTANSYLCFLPVENWARAPDRTKLKVKLLVPHCQKKATPLVAVADTHVYAQNIL
jgi:hypothetical protein